MLIFREFLKTQSDQNIHQNAWQFFRRASIYATEPSSIYLQPGAPNSAKFRGGCRFDKGGLLFFKNFYAIKISTF